MIPYLMMTIAGHVIMFLVIMFLVIMMTITGHVIMFLVVVFLVIVLLVIMVGVSMIAGALLVSMIVSVRIIVVRFFRLDLELLKLIAKASDVSSQDNCFFGGRLGKKMIGHQRERLH